MISWAAMAMACRPDEQNRLMVVAAVVTGRPASMAAMRATFCPCAPCGCAQPRITSSTSRGSRCGTLRRGWLIEWPARSSGRVMLKEPRNDLASPVRELATITASRMVLNASVYLRLRGLPAGRGDGGLSRVTRAFLTVSMGSAPREQMKIGGAPVGQDSILDSILQADFQYFQSAFRTRAPFPQFAATFESVLVCAHSLHFLTNAVFPRKGSPPMHRTRISCYL